MGSNHCIDVTANCKLIPTVSQIDNDEEDEISHCYWVNNGAVTCDVEFAAWSIMKLWVEIIHWIYLFYKPICYSMAYKLCVNT